MCEPAPNHALQCDVPASLRLLVEVCMDPDQMELEFPQELLAPCGRHRLGIYLIQWHSGG
jgi:hypothetical protein